VGILQIPESKTFRLLHLIEVLSSNAPRFFISIAPLKEPCSASGTMGVLHLPSITEDSVPKWMGEVSSIFFPAYADVGFQTLFAQSISTVV
jgi:hypothetical protein